MLKQARFVLQGHGIGYLTLSVPLSVRQRGGSWFLNRANMRQA